MPERVPGRASIDLNADLGEGFGAYRIADDEALLALVTSANVACGFHAGDPSVMRRTCEAAVARGVRIGAHVGYRDLVGFGRRALAVAPQDLRDEVLYQVGALSGFARAAGDRVRYVKPHGALYHAAAQDAAVAEAVVAATAEAGGEAGGEAGAGPGTGLAVLGPPGSALAAAAAAAGVEFVVEGFVDRSYTPAGTLTPRGRPGALLDRDAAVAQGLTLARTGGVDTDDGRVDVRARSLCLHGDSADAVATARALVAALREHDVDLVAFR